MVTRWWHGYQGEASLGRCAIILGGSTTHPEQLLAEGKATAPVRLFGEEITVYYVRSWDHEPSQAEMEAAGFDCEEGADGR